jgi:hypothetical protein
VNRVSRSEEIERLANDLLDRTRTETVQADNKASILLAGVLAVAGGTAAALGAGKWRPIEQPWYIAVPFWAAVAAALASITCLAAAIYPRRRIQTAYKPTTVGYFGDVAALDSPDQLHGLLTTSATRLLDIWIDQIWQMSAIVSRKYRLVRWSVRFLGAVLVLAIIVLVVATISGR